MVESTETKKEKITEEEYFQLLQDIDDELKKGRALSEDLLHAKLEKLSRIELIKKE
jgi:hypothetical protein